MSVLVAGQLRTLHYKEVPGLCWPKVTQDRPMRLILIKAPGYRLCKGSKLLYREPAFLITTDLTTPAAELIAAYLARWEVEVNFRDERTLLGVGHAQVRRPNRWRGLPGSWSPLTPCYCGVISGCSATGAPGTLSLCPPGATRTARRPRHAASRRLQPGQGPL